MMRISRNVANYMTKDEHTSRGKERRKARKTETQRGKLQHEPQYAIAGAKG